MSYKYHYTNVLQKTVAQMSYKNYHYTNVLQKNHYTNVFQNTSHKQNVLHKPLVDKVSDITTPYPS